MRLHRFYVNKPLGEELVVESAGRKELLHQWLHVFRYQSGDEVFLFSLQQPGTDFLYRFTSLSKQEATLVLISSTKTVVPKPLTLVMALVKKDTFETIVRQATELGVTRIIPLAATRSEKKNLNFERLSAIAVEAAEQSGRGTVPDITNICTLEEAYTQTTSTRNIVGSLHGEKVTLLQEKGGELCVWIGPEGGWTEEEEIYCREKGFVFIKTIDTVMRADTAAINLLSIVSVPF